jgi:hypothetical protein
VAQPGSSPHQAQLVALVALPRADRDGLRRAMRNEPDGALKLVAAAKSCVIVGRIR